MKPIKRSLKQILNRNKKSIVLSNSLENLLGELKSKHKYVIVDDYDTLMDSLKNISSSFFPDFVNFYKFEDNQNLIDPIYQDNIHIQNDIRPLIYSPPMQRLNHIRQLSFAYLEYKGANHTRFDHSLGVYHLTEKVYKKICENCKLKYSEDELSELLISALFHDIGHSPFSHSIEFILNDLDLNDKLFAKDILLKYYQNFIENDLGLNFNHILMNISPLDDIRKIGEKQQIFKTMLDGALDVDRVDYIRRDYFYCLGNPPALRYYLSEAGYCQDLDDKISMFALRDIDDSVQWIREIDRSRRNSYKKIYESDFSAYSDEVLIHALYYFCKKYIGDLSNNFHNVKSLINSLINLSDTFFISILYFLGDENTKNLLKKVQSRGFFKKIGYIDIQELDPERFNSDFFNFTLRGREKELRMVEKIDRYEKRIKNDLDLRGNVFISLPKVYIPSNDRENLCRKNPDLICVPLVQDFNNLTKFRLYHTRIQDEIKILPTRRQNIFIFIDDIIDTPKSKKIINKLCELIIHGFNSFSDFKDFKGVHKSI